MPATSEKLESTYVVESNEDINQILNNIKDVITNAPAQDNVLILTEKIREKTDHDCTQSSTDSIETHTVRESLLRKDVATAARAAIAQMLNTIADDMRQNSDNSKASDSATLEEIVVLLIKSELQKWLNKNLESMVKSIVETEIKRIMPQ
jgi:cell pole-organizing protein PopZ